MPAAYAGKRMYIYCAIGGITAVAADAGRQGDVLWETPEWTHTVIAPSPVPIGDGRILVTAGYGGGSMMLRMSESGGNLAVSPTLRLDRSVFACEQHSPVLHGGHLFSVLPNDAGAARRQMVCMHPDGKAVWRSGQTRRFGIGPYLLADNKFFILDDTGTLTMIRATLNGYEELGRARVLNGRDAWGPMAIVNGRLLLRDSTTMICLDMRADRGPGER
jgi:outer membrane protein assembly factor BamB